MDDNSPRLQRFQELTDLASRLSTERSNAMSQLLAASSGLDHDDLLSPEVERYHASLVRTSIEHDAALAAASAELDTCVEELGARLIEETEEKLREPQH